MPFPPLFASGSTYSNRYDLDKLDVLIDENYRSISESTYFEVIGIPSPLTYGKHYFTISFKPNNNLTTERKEYQRIENSDDSPERRAGAVNPLEIVNKEVQHYLREGSPVLFEFKDSEDNVIFSDLTTFEDIDGSAVAYVWVKQDPLRNFNDIQNGFGTFTIVAELDNVPVDWVDTYNYRCSVPVEIQKDRVNTSPILFQSSSLIGSSLELSESIHTDKGVLNQVTRSYMNISASNLDTFGGQVKYVEVSYMESSSFSEDFKVLAQYEVTASDKFEVTASSANGLNPLSHKFQFPMPRDITRDGKVNFELRFKNPIGEIAQDVSTGKEFVITASNRSFEGSPIKDLKGDGNLAKIDFTNLSTAGKNKISGSFGNLSGSLHHLIGKTALSSSNQIKDDISGSSNDKAPINSPIFTGTATFTENVALTGSILVKGAITSSGEFSASAITADLVEISGSVIFSSGSNIFGDSKDDVHDFSGSANIIAGDFKVTSGSTTLMKISSSQGKVGFGTEFPTKDFEFKGDISSSGDIFTGKKKVIDEDLNNLATTGKNLISGSFNEVSESISTDFGFVKGKVVISSSGQIATDISGSFKNLSGSVHHMIGKTVHSSSGQVALTDLGEKNFSSLASKPTTVSGYGITDAPLKTEISGAMGVLSGSLHHMIGKTTISSSTQIATDISGSFGNLSGSVHHIIGKTVHSASGQVALADLGEKDFSSLSSKPTTVSGYGITDAPSKSEVSGAMGVLSGSLHHLIGKTAVSSSNQISTDISGSFGNLSGSVHHIIGKTVHSSSGQVALTDLGEKNFSSLASKPTTISGYGITDAPLKSEVSGAMGVLSGSLHHMIGKTTVSSSNQIADSISGSFGNLSGSIHHMIGKTVHSSSGQVALADLGEKDFSNLTSKPTTVSGYGITDAPLKSEISGAMGVLSSSLHHMIGKTTVSSSNQIADSISGSFGNLSGSVHHMIGKTVHSESGQVSLANLGEKNFSSLASKPTTVSGYGITDAPLKTEISGAMGVLSSSLHHMIGKTTFSSSKQLPAGTVSSSTQTIDNLPGGTISGSTQVSFDGIQDKPTTVKGYGITDTVISSSTQIKDDISGSFTNTSASIAADINATETKLKAHWTFDNVTNPFGDTTGNGFTASFGDNPGTDYETRDGIIGKSLHIGKSEGLHLISHSIAGGTESISGYPEFSFTLWLKPDSVAEGWSSTARILSRDYSDYWMMGVRTGSSHPGWGTDGYGDILFGNSSNNSYIENAIVTGSWNFLALRMNQTLGTGSIVVYRGDDGSARYLEETSDKFIEDFPTDVANTRPVGLAGNVEQQVKDNPGVVGEYDDVRFYNKQLSNEEVFDLYNLPNTFGNNELSRSIETNYKFVKGQTILSSSSQIDSDISGSFGNLSGSLHHMIGKTTISSSNQIADSISGSFGNLSGSVHHIIGKTVHSASNQVALADLSEKNFSSLASKPTTIGGYGITDAPLKTEISGAMDVLSGSVHHMIGKTVHSASGQVSLANLGEKNFSSLTSKPTTVSGYGITDAPLKTEISGAMDVLSGSLHHMIGKTTVSSSNQIADSISGSFGNLSGSVHHMIGKTVHSSSGQVALADLGEKNFSNLTSKPTTISGYGITDAPLKSEISGAMDVLSGSLHHMIGKTTISSSNQIADSISGSFGKLSGSLHHMIGKTTVSSSAQVALADLGEKNFSNLTSKPTTIGGYGITDAPLKSEISGAMDVLSGSVHHMIGKTVHSASGQVALADLSEKNFSSLASKPTTVSGYGITDAPLKSEISGAMNVLSGSVHHIIGKTVHSASGQVALADLGEKNFSNLTSKPTTIGGYGITDAPLKTEISGAMGVLSGSLHHMIGKATVSSSNQIADSISGSFGNLSGSVHHIIGKTVHSSSGQVALADLSEKNFSNLTSKPTTISGYGITDAPLKSEISGAMGVLSGSVHHMIGKTVHSESAQVTLANLGEKNFSNLTSKPTTIGGYGITDAPLKTEISGAMGVLSGSVHHMIGKTVHSESAQVALADLGEKNFSNLTSKPTTISGYGITDAPLKTEISGAMGVLSGSVHHMIGKTVHSASGQVALADLGEKNFSSLASKPTTVSGYGITDAPLKSEISGAMDVLSGSVHHMIGKTVHSESSQVTYTDLSSIPGGIASSSAQVVNKLVGQTVSMRDLTTRTGVTISGSSTFRVGGIDKAFSIVTGSTKAGLRIGRDPNNLNKVGLIMSTSANSFLNISASHGSSNLHMGGSGRFGGDVFANKFRLSGGSVIGGSGVPNIYPGFDSYPSSSGGERHVVSLFTRLDDGSGEIYVMTGSQKLTLNMNMGQSATNVHGNAGLARLTVTGSITASAIHTPSITASKGTFTDLSVSGDISPNTVTTTQVVVGSDIVHQGDTHTSIDFGADTISIEAGGSTNFRSKTLSTQVFQPLTASIISSSGTIFAKGLTIKEGAATFDDGIVVNNGGGDESFIMKNSAAGILFAANYAGNDKINIGNLVISSGHSLVNVNGDLLVTSHITASNNISASGNITSSGLQVDGDVDVSGKILGKHTDVKFHAYTSDSNTEQFIPMQGVREQAVTDGSVYYTEWIAPYDGQIEKIIVMTSNASGTTTVKFRINSGIKATQFETVGAATPVTFETLGGHPTTVADRTFDAGDLLQISIDPTNVPGDVNVTTVWVYNIDSLTV